MDKDGSSISGFLPENLGTGARREVTRATVLSQCLSTEAAKAACGRGDTLLSKTYTSKHYLQFSGLAAFPDFPLKTLPKPTLRFVSKQLLST